MTTTKRKPLSPALPTALTPSAAISPGGLLAHDFRGPSWDLWRAILKAAWAESMTDAEIALFREVADRDPPKRRVRELWVCAGRRSGKDSVAAAIATLAACADYSPYLRTGERASVVCLASDRSQAAIVHRYIAGYFQTLPALQPLVARETNEVLELKNSVEIIVATNDFRAIRGKAVAVGILDEVGFWRSSEESASPDSEVFTALEGATLSFPEAMLIGISSPYRRNGILYDKWRRFYGKNDDDILVVHGASRTFNPTLSERIIDARLREDPEAGGAEYLAQWRNDVSDFLDRELVESAVDQGVVARPPSLLAEHVMAIDASGGRGSSFAAAVAHAEADGTVVVDALYERRAPFDPQDAVNEVAALAREYRVGTISGDKYAANWLSGSIADHGLVYVENAKDKSDLYLDSLASFTSGRVRLLDSPRLVHQFASLERRATKFGRDRVGPPMGVVDDIANSVAAAIAIVASDRPALVKQAAIAALSVPTPEWASAVYSTTVVGGDGMVATAFFAHHSRETIADPAQLTLIDIRMEQLAAAPIALLAGRLREARDSIKRAPSAWFAYVPASLCQQAASEGYSVEKYPEGLGRDLPALAVQFATHVHAGRFKVSEVAWSRSRELPLAAALSFRPGEKIEESAVRMAILYGVSLGLK